MHGATYDSPQYPMLIIETVITIISFGTNLPDAIWTIETCWRRLKAISREVVIVKQKYRAQLMEGSGVDSTQPSASLTGPRGRHSPSFLQLCLWLFLQKQIKCRFRTVAPSVPCLTSPPSCYSLTTRNERCSSQELNDCSIVDFGGQLLDSELVFGNTWPIISWMI